ncbi:DEAD/DEAH box helicase [Streptomyces uncialis]|uniref:RNA helicase n=1 Tax=Streptomyces uncialis TaxID=1048205 RepID=A0A1Q4VEW4_9ACTN|nr:DEAD/DEAH box helicase [Streptomyces uncialis]OKH96363.1 DEAD/DEAH box helicase [Streptomyces uncialis]
MTFRDLGILPETAEALEAVGIVTPFPIQEMTLPVALSGTDVIGQAKTGTGKTLGFGLPLVERVTVPVDVEAGRARPDQLTDAPQALVVVPTRELCTQVTNDLLTAGKVRNVRVLAIYGGRAYEPQVEALRKGVDIIVGTPGRLLDLAGQKKLDLNHIRSLVLDEADEMLDLGFLPDVEKIINMLPPKRQTMLFSATMPGAVIGLARRYMTQPTHISATSPDDENATVANTSQHVYRAHSMDKPELLSRILQADSRALAMVFCRTKRTAADIAEQLQRRGFASGAVHGDLGQGAREQALRAFRNGKVDVLVCTDVAARGIDVENVTHVINYQSPEDEKTYLHRIGRTGRAGASGTAITLVDWDDIPRWQLINKALDLPFPNPPETYSTSEHLFAELGIPAGTKGVLPRSERTRAGLAAEEVEDLGETGGRGAPRGRGGRGAPVAVAPEPERERAPRTPRRRRRTRAGSPMEAGAASVVETVVEQPSAPEAVGDEPRTPRRRRRTRAGAAGAAVTEPGTAEVAAEQAVAVVEAPAEAVAETVAEDKPRRRRTRKNAEPVAEVATETSAAPEPVEAAEPVEAKPRRRTRKAAQAPVADDTAEAAVAVEAPVAPVTPADDEPVVTKPRRRTRKAAVAAVTGEAVELPVAPVAPVAVVTETVAVGDEPVVTKPRRRTRKAVVAADSVPAPVVEAPVSPVADEAAEVTPRRRTRKKAVAEPVAPADGTVADAEAAAETAPKRRTRKKAVAAVESTDGTPVTAEAAEAPAKPRRTRAAKAVKAAAAEPAASQPADPEAKPRRRTRKVAEAPEG